MCAWPSGGGGAGCWSQATRQSAPPPGVQAAHQRQGCAVFVRLFICWPAPARSVAGMDDWAASGVKSSKPDYDDKRWDRRVQVCKRSVCRLFAFRTGHASQSTLGTACVVRNDNDMAALVTARHVVALHIGEGGLLDKTVEATFGSGQKMELSGSRVLQTSVPHAGAGAPQRPLDLVAIVLDGGRQFPEPPVPCALPEAVWGEVDGNAECTVLHHPEDHEEVVVSPRGRLVASPAAPSSMDEPWMVVHDTVTAAGSSGGMLLDHQCRAVAVHVGTLPVRAQHAGMARRKFKCAILLSAFHTGLGEASPWCRFGPVDHVSCVDFRLPLRYANLIGRSAALRELTRRVRYLGQAVVASTGLPGVGKSVLVTEWVHQRRLSGACGVVAWVRADLLANVHADLLELAKLLGLPLGAVANLPVHQQAAWVARRLEAVGHGEALLVFDNVENYTELKPFVPAAAHCHAVFTVRNKLLFSDDCVLPLEPFKPAESLALLRLLVKRNLDDAERDFAEQLCAEVGHVPLAIAQLASYASVSGEWLSDVLGYVRERAAATAPLVTRVAAYARPQSVVGALQLVQQQLLDEAGLQTLHRLALLEPDRVPCELLGPCADTHALGALAMVVFPEQGWSAPTGWC